MFFLTLAVFAGMLWLFQPRHEKPPRETPLEGLPPPEETSTGDFDGMVRRNEIRALSPYSKTFYYLDGAEQRGLSKEDTDC